MAIVSLIACVLVLPQSRYEVNGQSVEILGLGLMHEGVFEGWGTTGARDPSLSELVNRSLGKMRDGARSQFIVPGKKNRYLVVREKSKSPQQPNLFVTGVGADDRIRQQVQLRSVTVMAGSGTSRETIRLLSLAVEPIANETSLSVRETSNVATEARKLRTEPRTRCTIESAEFELVSVEKQKPDQFSSRVQWLYKVKISRSDDIDVTLAPVDKQGMMFWGADEHGRPLVRPGQGVYNPVPSKDNSRKQPPMFGGSGAFPSISFSARKVGEVGVQMWLDPKFIAAYQVYGRRSRIVTLGPVPLDPVRE